MPALEYLEVQAALLLNRTFNDFQECIFYIVIFRCHIGVSIKETIL
jgi:hypothetical protein